MGHRMILCLFSKWNSILSCDNNVIVGGIFVIVSRGMYYIIFRSSSLKVFMLFCWCGICSATKILNNADSSGGENALFFWCDAWITDVFKNDGKKICIGPIFLTHQFCSWAACIGIQDFIMDYYRHSSSNSIWKTGIAVYKMEDKREQLLYFFTLGGNCVQSVNNNVAVFFFIHYCHVYLKCILAVFCTGSVSGLNHKYC